MRSAFQRDRDRIIHSAAFRRLKYKTQVFVYHEGDYYRTRLTHSLEVAQIARTVSRALGLDEDLAEALALAHDLGHTPFGHSGEDALDAAMKSYGGFDHNDQTLRVLTLLEKRYAEFDGLNLTWETLEGVVKHNGPLKAPPPSIKDYVRTHDLELGTWPGAEAQVAALADDIAYNNHDIDDGLSSGMVAVEQLRAVRLFREADDAVRGAGVDEPSVMRHQVVRRIIDRCARDLIATTSSNLAASGIRSGEDVRRSPRQVAYSGEMAGQVRELKAFLFKNLYRHYRVVRMGDKAGRILRDLFQSYVSEPLQLPPHYQARLSEDGVERVACDYIAGMTDRFALDEHRKLFDPLVKV